MAISSIPSATSTTSTGIAGIIFGAVAGVLGHFFPQWSWLTDIISGALASSAYLIAQPQHAAPPPAPAGLSKGD